MDLTFEQKKIVNSSGNIIINAVAGSGKTTTLVEYAKHQPLESKILYLAFNKSVKKEAIKKFSEKGISNVRVETAHSLAYGAIMRNRNYTLNAHGYKNSELVDLLEIKGNGEKYFEYIIAYHVGRFVSYFCNSNKEKVRELDYREVVFEKDALTFVRNFYSLIEMKTRHFLKLMWNGEIEITHDFYLKMYQLSKPRLPYDYILFDEGQDASPPMLDIFLNQQAVKVIVGDTHQQIYGWRYAINSLEQVDFQEFKLSTSFRFNQEIADLALDILALKQYINREIDFSIVGVGGKKTGSKTKATLGRTNLGLLVKAIEYVVEKQLPGQIYFEGNINSYTYAEEGASLYDVLNLWKGYRAGIKDKFIRQMSSLDDLRAFIKATGDRQLAMMVDLVDDYGSQLPEIIKKVKEKHILGNDKLQADMVFSTVHKCKGMEYDFVQLANDFITEEELEKIKIPPNNDLSFGSQTNEEINLLYVAVTRTKQRLYIPEMILPKCFEPTNSVRVIRTQEVDSVETSEHFHSVKSNDDWTKVYSENKIREKLCDAYKPWTEELDEELTMMYFDGVNMKDIAQHMGRSGGAIRSRIKKLQLE